MPRGHGHQGRYLCLLRKACGSTMALKLYILPIVQQWPQGLAVAGSNTREGRYLCLYIKAGGSSTPEGYMNSCYCTH